MRYPVIVEKSEYGYDVHCPVLPGCHSHGHTLEEALENIKESIGLLLKMVTEEKKNAQIYEVEVEACLPPYLKNGQSKVVKKRDS